MNDTSHRQSVETSDGDVFEINDFTVVTEWEHFVTAMDDACRQLLHDDRLPADDSTAPVRL